MRIVQDVAMAQLLGYAVSLRDALLAKRLPLRGDCYRDYDNGTDFWSVFDREQTLGALAAAGICVRDPPPDGADALAIPFRWPVAASDVPRARLVRRAARRAGPRRLPGGGDVDEACVAHWRDEDDFVRSEHALDRDAYRAAMVRALDPCRAALLVGDVSRARLGELRGIPGMPTLYAKTSLLPGVDWAAAFGGEDLASMVDSRRRAADRFVGSPFSSFSALVAFARGPERTAMADVDVADSLGALFEAQFPADAAAVGDPCASLASASEKFAKRLVRHTCAVGAERAPLAADELFDLREKKTKRGAPTAAKTRAPFDLASLGHTARTALAPEHAGAQSLPDVMAAKFVKLQFLRFDVLKRFEIFVWADAAPRSTPRSSRALRPFGENPRAALALEPHPQRNSSAEELDHCLEPEAPPRSRAQRLEAQRAAYGRVAGWSDDRGLYWAAFFAARRRPAASALFDAWWLEVRRWQYRDQISLPFALAAADPPLATFRAFGEAPPRPLPREQALCATLVGDVTRCCRRAPHRARRRRGSKPRSCVHSYAAFALTQPPSTMDAIASRTVSARGTKASTRLRFARALEKGIFSSKTRSLNSVIPARPARDGPTSGAS
ncbi:hypothetical protein JL722_6161 [Aureococcus anophagefferens]|nr:hypothetical protein JL722_6161 [Aureococcus anophagefferens]